MVFLVILAIAWAAMIVPPMMRRQREGRPGNSVVSFRQQLSTLERATPGSHLRPIPNMARPLGGSTVASRPSMSASMGRNQVIRRRRDVLVGLLGASAVTFLLAVAVGGTMITLLFLASASALGAYVYALVQMRKRSTERSAKVRVLRPQSSSAMPAMALRRSASS